MRLFALAIALTGIAPGIASATPIVFQTQAGAKDSETPSQPISAKATFDLSTSGQITITLQNLIVDQTSAGQNVTGLSFKVGSATQTATLTSSSGTKRHFTSKSAWTDSSVSDAGWRFPGTLTTETGPNLSISWFNRDKNVTGQQSQFSLIGAPGTNDQYNNANSSLFNNAHNPLLANTITFVISDSGVTPSTVISNVVFSFGTAAGDDHTGVQQQVASVPEPTTMALALTVLPIVALARRLRRREGTA